MNTDPSDHRDFATARPVNQEVEVDAKLGGTLVPPKCTWWHWRWYHWLTLLLIGGTSALIFLPTVRTARERERREQCGRNLNVLANAALEYEIP